LNKHKTSAQSDGRSLEKAKSGTNTNKDEKTQVPISLRGSVVRYTDPDTQRTANGIIGRYNKEAKKYEVDFTFLDGEAPKTSIDFCTYEWIEEHMIDNDTARAWIEAVDKAFEIDSPNRKKNEKLPVKKKDPPTILANKPAETPETKRPW
jgi:hypothetical protein